MLKNSPRERACHWRLGAFQDLELLKATYVQQVFPRHMHETYVIGVIEDGLEEFYCRGAIHRAAAGSVIIVNPGDVHTGYAGDKAFWKYRTMYPTAELVREAISHDDALYGHIPFFPDPVVHDDPLANQLRQLHAMLVSDGQTLETETVLRDTFRNMVRRHARDLVPEHRGGANHVAVQRAREYLLDNYSDNVTINELSEVAGLSPFHLIHSFRKVVGMPPHKFLVNMRIERAKRLLADGHAISEVAYETGFADQSHLTRRFKRLVGVTPGQYQRQ